MHMTSISARIIEVLIVVKIMTDMYKEKEDVEVPRKKYKLEPPDGGWGYVIMMSVSLYHTITSLQPNSFGMIYGKFLSSMGDETSQTGLVCGIYFTVQMLSGCVTNFLLRRYSYRKIGIIGSIIYLLGAVGVVFVQNLIHLIISFGILEGIGAGFMLGAVYCSFDSYFSKKLNLMMSVLQVTNGLGITITPYIAALMVEHLVFRKTLIAITVLSFINIVNMFTLVPVKHNMKKIYIEEENMYHKTVRLQQKDYSCSEQNSLLLVKENGPAELGEMQKEHKSSSTKINTIKQKIPFIDIDLLQSTTYWNISCGCALAVIADLSFCALVPVLLGTIGFELSDIAFMITVSFGCDLAGRMLFVLCTRFFKFRCKHAFLIGCTLMIIFRTVFILDNSYNWRLISLAIIGLIRCLETSTLVAVLSEEFKEKFVSAFTLNMVKNGIAALIYGGLGSIIKNSTGSDEMVVHLLTVGNVLCVICWSTEMIYKRFRAQSKTKIRC